MIPLHRETTPERINALVNHPEVRPWVAPGAGEIDVSAQVLNPNNILLMGEHGCCAFLKLLPGIYEVHTQVLPSGRGAWTQELLRSCFYWMFLRTDCYEIVTRVPQGHIAAKAVAIALSLNLEFVREKECNFRDRLVDVSIYGIRIQDWIPTEDRLVDVGRNFHTILANEAKRLGVTEPPHDNDDNHNRYVGAVIEMSANGKGSKALTFYNRWALLCRHAPISLVNNSPVVFKIDNGMFITINTDGSVGVSLP